MKIAILGSGQVGRALGAGLARHGHEVVMGSRDPRGEAVRGWVAEVGERARAAPYAEAASACDLACVVTSWSGTENALSLAGAAHLAGKVVVDVTNPLGFGESGPFLVVGGADSAGEQVQRWLPDAHVVKAWNTVNANQMVDPTTPGGPADMLFCGNDAAAKQTVADLLSDCGWVPLDMGGIDSARYIEAVAILWIKYAIAHGTTDHAFTLLRS